MIAGQAKNIADMNKKLSEFNHRFNDLAGLLKTHFQSKQIQDEITPLIQPITAEPMSSHAECSTSSTPRFTSVVSRRQGRYNRQNNKTTEQRAKQLKDNMDAFKDEVKL